MTTPPKSFTPEYVTNVDGDAVPTSGPVDLLTEAGEARARLAQRVEREAEYAGRDRDVLLLHLLEVVEVQDKEIATLRSDVRMLLRRSGW